MADRRNDETTPLAPRRPLGATDRGDERDSEESRRPLTERVTAAVGAVSGGRGGTSTGPSGQPRGGAMPQRPTEPRSTRPPGGRPPAPARGTRKARLRLTHLDPWSVMKTSLLLSIAFGIVVVVAVAVVWGVLGAAGVWQSINNTVADVVGGETGNSFDVQNYVGTSRVLGFTMVVAAVDVVLVTAIATLSAFLYNLAAALLGGLEVTLAEDDH